MKTAEQSNEGMKKVADLIDDIGIGMLTSEDAHGSLVSRPMQALEIDAAGSLWFFTSADSHKVDESPKVNVAFADADDASYVSVSGRGALVKDRAKIDELWTAMAKPWFPNGKDDPNLALLRVDVDSAEYWDSNSSKMVRLMAMAASSIAGKPIGMGENRTVQNS